MNHARIETTQVYLRALNKSKAMEAVRDLSWGLGFEELAVKAHTGFEPVLGETLDDDLPRHEHEEVAAPELPAELQRVVERITRRERAGADEPSG